MDASGSEQGGRHVTVTLGPTYLGCRRPESVKQLPRTLSYWHVLLPGTSDVDGVTPADAQVKFARVMVLVPEN